MRINDLIRDAASWMSGGGPEEDVVISSRLRLARNVGGYPFLSRISAAQRRELHDVLRRTVTEADVLCDAVYVDLEEAQPVDRFALMERHLISRELAGGEGPRGVAFRGDETASIMINEEDHLRMQTIEPGLAPDEGWNKLNRIDDHIGSRVNYAFRPDFGFLTACPTNVGTGLRVSVMLHLPALVMSNHLDKVFNAMAKLDMMVRGLYGEGTEASGDLYQISNQKTLGKSEADIVENLKSVVPQVVSYERRVREAMMNENLRQVEDQIYRAEGILASARMVGGEETLYLLSRLRLGVNLGIIDNVDIGTINRLLVTTRSAHLQKMMGRETSQEERQVARADYVRKTLTDAREGAGRTPADDTGTATAPRAQAPSPVGTRVGTEHLLLDLLAEDGAATRVLAVLGVDVDAVRRELKAVARGEAASVAKVPFSRHAGNALRHAVDEAQRLGRKTGAAEPMLLGLLHEEDSTAATVLKRHGATFAEVKRQLLRGDGPDRPDNAD